MGVKEIYSSLTGISGLGSFKISRPANSTLPLSNAFTNATSSIQFYNPYIIFHHALLFAYDVSNLEQERVSDANQTL
jgi:hypothetical protein